MGNQFSRDQIANNIKTSAEMVVNSINDLLNLFYVINFLFQIVSNLHLY